MRKRRAGYDTTYLRHAIVIGASMTGLLAARVLSDFFERVTVIERDQRPELGEPRKGVPQGRHVHLLLQQGEMILRELFPELFTALAQAGATPVSSDEMRWYEAGRWKGLPPNPITGYMASRPLLEHHVQRFVEARANVTFLYGCDVSNMCITDEGGQVSGVSLTHLTENRRQETLTADLVVDASGRGSRMPGWLAALGYGNVAEERVQVDVGYATRIYRGPRSSVPDWKILVIYPTPPHDKRSGIVFPIEHDLWMVTLSGRLRDYPPDDNEGFLAYARSLSDPSLYTAINEAEALTPIATYKYAANCWRHYERMARLPEGLIILGDATCAFNPVYGQGMSVAALEARLLEKCLRQLRDRHNSFVGVTRQFQRALANVVQAPWQMATSEDFRYPETQGKRPFGLATMHWYSRRVNELTASDPIVAERFYQVLQLLKPPTLLFTPRVMWAVLRQEVARYRRTTAGGATAAESVGEPGGQASMQEIR